MKDIFISGSIGYIHLNNDNNHILLLSDNHSSTNYCTNKNSTFISEWLLTKNNSKVLLEEVPRKEDSKLLELWPSIQHTQELKDLYLNQKINNKQIEGIDIRLFLIPFNLDIFKIDNIDKKDIKNIYINDYLNSLNNFFELKHKYFIENIGNVYTDINNEQLNNHFLELKKKFIYLKKQYHNNFLVININEEFKNKLDELLSSIMEWYTIAKIFYNNKLGINKFIIHAGLFHTTNLNKILIDSYGYEKINSNGIIDIDKIKDDNDVDDDNCLKIPSHTDSQFGGYDKKYKKYKGKYLALKKQYFGKATIKVTLESDHGLTVQSERLKPNN
jgi:hypothetical protein